MSSRLLDTATEVFARQGYETTSLEDIAVAMGISRPALYNYVSTKSDLLEMLVEQVTRSLADVLDTLAARTDLSPHDKLVSVVSMLTRQRAEHPEQFRILDRSETALPKALGAEHLQAKRKIVEDLSAVIDQGMDSGEFRQVDARVTALAILGMCNWVAWWFRPGGDVDAVVATITGHAEAMLVADTSRGRHTELARLADELEDLATQVRSAY
jgi:AcrR family transcriptional regulator